MAYNKVISGALPYKNFFRKLTRFETIKHNYFFSLHNQRNIRNIITVFVFFIVILC